MKPFGHVGDHTSQAQQVSPDKIPVFDQTHVDYLIKTFHIGAACPIVPKGVDDAVAIIGWNSADLGQREVINHIQELVKKGRPL